MCCTVFYLIALLPPFLSIVPSFSFVSVVALDAFDIELSHFTLVNINLTLDANSMFDPNISTIFFGGVGKYGYHSNLNSAIGQLCILEASGSKGVSFDKGCSAKDYQSCRSKYSPHKFIAMVDRGGCDMSEKAVAASKALALGVIIIETSSVVDPINLKEYDQIPHSNKFHQTYKATSLDHSFVREPQREKSEVPYVICTKNFGNSLRSFVNNGSMFEIAMFNGGAHGTELRVPSSSLLLVFVAFIVLTIISMIWLIFYYVQRFRYHHHQDRVISQVRKATKKAFRMMPTRILRDGDQELDPSYGRCAICLETYKLWDMIRELPCNHIYHKACVDAWLGRKPACPNCKSNVLKALGFDADYDWTCLDASSEPDAISLLDLVPQVVSVQVFAPNTAPPSRFITELTTIPHSIESNEMNNSENAVNNSGINKITSVKNRSNSIALRNQNEDRTCSIRPTTTTVATIESTTQVASNEHLSVAVGGHNGDASAASSVVSASRPICVNLEVETYSSSVSSSHHSNSPSSVESSSSAVSPTAASTTQSISTTSTSNPKNARSFRRHLKRGVLAAINGDSKV